MVMKADIHPQWYTETTVTCVCGNTFKVGSTKPTITVEICHKCHPFFTGEMKYVDTLGRVEKFQKKQEKAKKSIVVLEAKKQKIREKKQEAKHPKSLREMLLGSS